MSIQFYFMLLMTILIIVASVLQHLSEKRSKQVIREGIKANKELCEKLMTLQVSADQLGTFKHHVRILLEELGKSETHMQDLNEMIKSGYIRVDNRVDVGRLTESVKRQMESLVKNGGKGL